MFITIYLNNFILKPTTSYVVFFLSVAILLGLFLLIYPVANNPHNFTGSDSDEALNIAVNDLIKCNFPYYEKTYLGNAITQMPGALFMTVPFVFLFGNSSYQNFFWIILFILFLIKYLPSRQLSLYLFLILFFFIPIIPYHIFTGSDYIANSIYVLLSLYLLYHFIESKINGPISYIFAFLAGFCLSSRPVFLLLLPVMFLFLFRKYNLKTAFIHSAIIVAGFLIVTLPFFFYDISGFSPLHTIYKLSRFNNILPYSEIFIPLLSVAVAVVYIIISKRKYSFDFLLMSCFIVLFIPVLSGFVLSSIQSVSINYGYTYFSTFYIFFITIPLFKNLNSFSVHPRKSARNNNYEKNFHADTTDNCR